MAVSVGPDTLQAKTRVCILDERGLVSGRAPGCSVTRLMSEPRHLATAGTPNNPAMTTDAQPSGYAKARSTTSTRLRYRATLGSYAAAGGGGRQ
jgi:hypothetical protein